MNVRLQYSLPSKERSNPLLFLGWALALATNIFLTLIFFGLGIGLWAVLTTISTVVLFALWFEIERLRKIAAEQDNKK